MTRPLTPATIIDRLGLRPHPEGGHYVENYRDSDGMVSSIYFLLCAGENSHWHRVKNADEIWAWHAGDPLNLTIAEDGQPVRAVDLGIDLARGHLPQAVVPAGAWQSAASLGAWTLVGCVVAPAFTFESFELAAPGWQPPGS